MVGVAPAAFALSTPQDGHVPSAIPALMASPMFQSRVQSTPALLATAMDISIGSQKPSKNNGDTYPASPAQPDSCKKNAQTISVLPAHTRALIDFMRQLHLEQYTHNMIKQGYDDLDFMSSLSKKELQEV